MKNCFRNLLLSLSLAAAASVYGAGMPSVGVTVSDAAGHVAYKGRTNAGGTFATGKLAPGDYVVQFSSAGAPAGNYALVVSAGKEKTVAEAVPGTKFGGGGVAMRIKVGKDMNVTGQLSTGKAGAVAAKAGSTTQVKIVNGKRYLWVGPETGSNIGGHWVEEGSPEAQNLTRLNKQGVQSLQDRPTSATGN
ncbi:MAG: carboxypeptidase-like regulatory domain-containing protein [Chthoniobacterales bacterium]